VIAAAALLVLLGLGLFIAGVVTGVTVLYWACVAACVVAAVLLVLVRRRTGTASPATPTAAERPADSSPAAEPETAEPPASPSDAAAPEGQEAPLEEAPDPGIEEVEVTDLLVVVDLKDEVLVVDEHPRYHVAECTWLAGRDTIPLPLDEARTDGFTPCAVCSPDRTLAERARARRHTTS
jgi:hypothetical protein